MDGSSLWLKIFKTFDGQVLGVLDALFVKKQKVKNVGLTLSKRQKIIHISRSVGLEPTLPEGIWFLVRRLNHSATTASYFLSWSHTYKKAVFSLWYSLKFLGTARVFVKAIWNFRRPQKFRENTCFRALTSNYSGIEIQSSPVIFVSWVCFHIKA